MLGPDTRDFVIYINVDDKDVITLYLNHKGIRYTSCRIDLARLKLLGVREFRKYFVNHHSKFGFAWHPIADNRIKISDVAYFCLRLPIPYTMRFYMIYLENQHLSALIRHYEYEQLCLSIACFNVARQICEN